MPVEQEVKLAFDDVEMARRTVVGAGGHLVVPRRLVEDVLYDTTDAVLRRARSALRLRREGDIARLTWKGPVQPGPVKSREEIETTVGSVSAIHAILLALGYRPVFRAQKYREEYSLPAALVTVDQAPCGVFVEIEATPERIAEVAAGLGRATADYRLESYPTLWRQWCEARGVEMGDMLFDSV